MKANKWITALLLTISITLSIYTIADNSKQTTNIYLISGSVSDISNRVSALEGKSILQNPELANKPLIDEMEALTRENENLRQENRDLKTQIKEFGWLKEANEDVK
jgi:hypothetical protein